jgi:class 3 adenylate cyclase
MKVQSRNFSIMMTDIQGYTGTSSSSSRAEIVDLIRRHSNLMEPVFTFYGGTVVKTIGDAFLVTFPSATDAVVCAIMIQLLLREYNRRHRDPAKQLNLRVVINTGDVTVENNDIFGDAVNITARMEGLDCFPGGTIGISESTYLLMNRNEITAKKIGPVTMKGIPYEVTVYEVPLQEQRLTEIPTRLLDLMETVVEGNDSETARKFKELLKSVSPAPSSEKSPEQEADQIKSEISVQQAAPLPVEADDRSVQKSSDPACPPVSMRIKSFFVDLIVIVICVKAMGFLMPLFRPGKRIFWIFTLYFTVSWGFFSASVGQSIYNLKVIRLNGKKIGIFKAFLRSVVTMFTIITVIGLPIIFLGRKESLPDIITSSKVMIDNSESRD